MILYYIDNSSINSHMILINCLFICLYLSQTINQLRIKGNMATIKVLVVPLIYYIKAVE